MVTILVTYWVQYNDGDFAPGDMTVATDHFPATDLDIMALRVEVQRTVQMESGRRRVRKIIFNNIVRLG